MEASKNNIQYTEYRAIVQILKAHSSELGNKLKAFVVFGPVVFGGFAYDISLLEIIEDFGGYETLEFQSTVEVPLRGRLLINLLSPKEFERTGRGFRDKANDLTDSIVSSVKIGYITFFEEEPGYVDSVLTPGVRSGFTSDARAWKRTSSPLEIGTLISSKPR